MYLKYRLMNPIYFTNVDSPGMIYSLENEPAHAICVWRMVYTLLPISIAYSLFPMVYKKYDVPVGPCRIVLLRISIVDCPSPITDCLTPMLDFCSIYVHSCLS